uniref:Oxysterol-binding protein n=1 Tax=Soboliphyme baturini TaxID=241478 RepID=A0A183IJQ1_9BILA
LFVLVKVAAAPTLWEKFPFTNTCFSIADLPDSSSVTGIMDYVRPRSNSSIPEHSSSGDLRSPDGIISWHTCHLNSGNYNRRTKLPALMIKRSQINLWSILKQSIGKELTKITMPIVFNEPITFLQRIAEYMEYYELLQQAAVEENPLKRMEIVAAFAVSALACNWERVAKPFNPLLGETYELDRSSDLGVRIVCEQVSHHPPISAFHVDGDGFSFYGSIYPKVKFWGQSVIIEPKGVITVELHKSTDSLFCRSQSLHDQHGVMEIVSHSSGLKCKLHFKPTSNWFGKDGTNHIEGTILSRSKTRLRSLYGEWTKFLASCDPDSYDSNFTIWGKERQSYRARESSYKAHRSISDDSSIDIVLPLLTGSTLLWCAKPRPSCSREYYNFTSFAMMLNEYDSERDRNIPLTDSRLRPDVRHMENGDIEHATTEKSRLEEKQRQVTAQRKKDKNIWKPL